MKLPPQLEKLSQVKHAKIIGIVMTFILDVLLIILAMNINPDAGYYLMMVGLVLITFFVPYLFGWRDGKKMAIVGVAMFFIVGAINGPLIVNSYYAMEEPEPANLSTQEYWRLKSYVELENNTYTSPEGYWYRLENGTVSNYKGDTGVEYVFTVTYYSNDTTTRPIQLGTGKIIHGLWFWDDMEKTVGPPDFLNGTEYSYSISIDSPGIHYYWFAVVLEAGTDTTSLNTTANLGPLVGSQVDNWGVFIPIGALSMFCNIGLLFLIVVVLYWWLGTAKAKRREWDDALREKEQENEVDDRAVMDDALEPKPFTCDQCGAPVGADDHFCPKCGERFDGVEGEEGQEAGGSNGEGAEPRADEPVPPGKEATR